jgi:hypothetical protein
VSKIENHKRCDNCSFSRWIVGVDRPVLVCKERKGYVGSCRSLYLDSSCTNFYPSSTFKAGSKAERRIPLTQGKFAIVDADDYYRLVKYKWHINDPASNTLYAARRLERKSLKMHRVIMAAPDHLVVDHIDHNGLNNCKSNLRLCTLAQNNRNCGSSKGASSRYKGVSWRKDTKKWEAMIRFNKKMYRLGTFKNEIDAARAYDKKAASLFGEFAYLNFPLVASKL